MLPRGSLPPCLLGTSEGTKSGSAGNQGARGCAGTGGRRLATTCRQRAAGATSAVLGCDQAPTLEPSKHVSADCLRVTYKPRPDSRPMRKLCPYSHSAILRTYSILASVRKTGRCAKQPWLTRGIVQYTRRHERVCAQNANTKPCAKLNSKRVHPKVLDTGDGADEIPVGLVQSTSSGRTASRSLILSSCILILVRLFSICT
jgi:hypothetical protein